MLAANCDTVPSVALMGRVDPQFQRLFHSFTRRQAAVEQARSSEFGRLFKEFAESDERSRSIRAPTTPRLNILEPFGLSRRELCHSAVLAWFLSENSDHEQGSLFLSSLLRLLRIDCQHLKHYVVQREKPGRVDVAAFASAHFAVFVENKVDAKERRNQFEDLINALARFSRNHAIPVERTAAVFLTEDGRSPESCTQLPKNAHCLSRISLFKAFVGALESPSIRKSHLLTHFLASYLRSIQTEPNHYEDPSRS